MAADAFTQIRNAVFRDPRLSAKAMGIFGNISTHRDGWGITAEAMSTQMRDGVNSIKSGLRELEAHGYLRRTRERREDGTLGGAVYFITDQPEAFTDEPELEKPRSEPADDLPTQVGPTQVGPTLVDHLHKKTIPPEDQLEEDHLSLPHVPEQRTTSERETFAPPNNKPTTTPAAAPVEAADRIIDAYTTILGRPLLTRTRSVLHQQAAEALTAGYPEAWLTDRARELAAHGWSDLAKHVEKSTVPLPGTTPPAAASSGLPPWCGKCGNGMPARLNIRFRRRDDGTLCHCHPDAARQPLPGTDTTVSGWLALAARDHNGYQPYREPTAEDRAADLGHF